MKLKPLHQAELLTSLLFLLAVGSSRADLPPDAQDLVNKGISAAKQQDYLQAATFFQDARKIATNAPEIYFNLGLAESKIPSRELRAICWFEAYLASTTNAPNAAAVEDQINALYARNLGNLSQVIVSAQEAIQTAHTQYGDNYALCSAAGLWAEAGLMPEALKTIHLIEDNDKAAQTTFNYDRDNAYASIAEGQAEAGDIAGAQKSAELIKNGSLKCAAQVAIAVEQIKSGDMAGAKQTFASARQTAESFNNSGVFNNLAEAQAQVGDIAGAQQTVDLMSEDWQKDAAKGYLAKAQVTAGDYAGAHKTIESIPDSDAQWKQSAQVSLSLGATFPNVSQSPVQVSVTNWLHKLDDDGSSQSFESGLTDKQLANDCPLNTRPYLDLGNYLKSLPQSDNPYMSLLDALIDSAKKMVKSQNVIREMLKQQARMQANNANGLSPAAGQLSQGTDLGPVARYNLALAKEVAGDYAGALDDLRIYQQFKLSDEEARTVQDKISALEAKQQLKVSDDAAKAKAEADEQKAREEQETQETLAAQKAFPKLIKKIDGAVYAAPNGDELHFVRTPFHNPGENDNYKPEPYLMCQSSGVDNGKRSYGLPCDVIPKSNFVIAGFGIFLNELSVSRDGKTITEHNAPNAPDELFYKKN